MTDICCMVCNSYVLSWQDRITFYNSQVQEGSTSPKLRVCHRNCLVCSVCKLSVDIKSCLFTNEKQILCERHRDGKHEDFISVLRTFKSKSKELLGIATSGNSSSYKKTSCPCAKQHPFVQHASGYSVECWDSNLACHQVSNKKNRTTSNYEIEVTENVYKSYYYGSKHWNYFSNDGDIGPIIISIKQEFIHSREYLRIIVRSVSLVIHGVLPLASLARTGRVRQEDILYSLGKELKLSSPLQSLSTNSAPADLIKLDQMFMKTEFKAGIVYMKEGQTTEEALLDNLTHSSQFDDFLNLLGDRIRLLGFDKYRGGLDNVGDLTGTHSVFTSFHNYQIMFHVSTLLPVDETDTQKLQRKRHIGNDIVCIVYMESVETMFNPEFIKSSFLHTYIAIKPDNLENPSHYEVAVVSRDSVPSYGPSLIECHTFKKGPEFREWLLTKLLNGEYACYKAPKFASMQNRTREHMMTEIVGTAEAMAHDKKEKQFCSREHCRWLPCGSQRPTSPLEELILENSYHTDTSSEQDCQGVINGSHQVCDINFIVGKCKQKMPAVRSVMAAQSRIFHKLLYGSMNSLDSLIRSPTPSAETSPVVQPKTYKRSKSASFIQSRSGKLSFDPSNLRISRSASTQNSSVKLSSITDLKETYSYSDSKTSKSVQNQFLVEEFEPDVFGALLDFVHSSHCEVSAEILPCLLCAAEYYDLPDLGHYCWNALHKHDKPNEICTMLNSLQGYMEYSSAVDLQDKLLASVEENPEDVLNTSEVTELPYKTFQSVLERCKKARDMTRFLAIERWVEAKSKNSFDQANYDELAKSLVASHVDVQNLSPEELQEVYPTGLAVAEDKSFPRLEFPETAKDLDSMTALMSASNLLE